MTETIPIFAVADNFQKFTEAVVSWRGGGGGGVKDCQTMLLISFVTSGEQEVADFSHFSRYSKGEI